MEGFDLSTITNAYIGNTAVSSIYLGDTLIWPTTPIDYEGMYLTFKALENTTFSFTRNDLQYSLDDGATWTTLTAGTSTPTINAGDKILWKQTGLTPNPTYGSGIFSSTGQFDVYGNIMSLLYGDNFIGQISLSSSSIFMHLFEDCSLLINAKNLILPATTLAHGCYSSMFAYCTSLTTAPELPATTLAKSCYTYMFINCTSLQTAPALPATTLTEYCYAAMFAYCSSLTTAPELPATTLVSSCYESMFNNSSSINYIKCLATDRSATNCTYNWVSNVASTGTFVKDTNMTWPRGSYGIPSGWTVIDV